MTIFTDYIPETEAIWLAVKVKFKCEKTAARLLDSKNINCYLPTVERTRKYGNRVRKSRLPLINNFVFVNIVKDQYTGVLGTEYVYDFLKIGNELVRVKEEEIALLQRITGENVEAYDQLSSQLEIGDEVRIIAGKLTGLRGRIIEIRNKKKLVVKLESLNMDLAVELPKESVYQ